MPADVTITEWTSADRKYKVCLIVGNGVFRFEATRHGQPWRNLEGDQLVLALFQELTGAAKETKDA